MNKKVLIFLASALLSAMVLSAKEPTYSIYKFSMPEGYAAASVSDIFCQEDGTLWTCTSDGLVRIDAEGAKAFSCGRVFKTVQDFSGNVWVLTEKQLLKFIPGSNLFEETGLSISCILPLEDFCIFGGPSAIYKYKYEDESLCVLKETNLSNDWVFSWTSGSLLVVSRDGTCSILNPENGDFSSAPFSLPDSRTVFVDSNKRIWRSTPAATLECYSTKGALISTYSFSSAPVTTFCEHDGELYVGTFGAGLKIFDPSTSTFSSMSLNPADYLSESALYTSALCSGNGSIYAAGPVGGPQEIRETSIICYPGGSKAPAPVRDALMSSSFDKHTVRPVSGKNYCFDFNKLYSTDNLNEPVYELEEGQSINSVAADASGKLWLATSAGLIAFNPWSKEGTVFCPETVKDMKSVVCDAAGRVWIGSAKGLCFFNSAQKTFYNVGVKDGFHSCEFLPAAGVCASDGYVYLPAKQGIVSVSPDFSPAFSTSPVISLKSFIAGGKVVKANKSGRIKLLPSDNTVAITVQAPGSVCEHLKFVLKNHSKETVVETNDPCVVFNSLSPGRYKVSVASVSPSCEWTDLQPLASFGVMLLAPQDLWIMIGLLVLLAVAVFFLLRKMPLQKSADRPVITAQGINDERLSFVTNVTSEMRTPLTLVIGPLERVVNSLQPNDPNLKKLQGVYGQALRLRSLLNTILTAQSVDLGDTPLNLEVQQFNKWISPIVDEFRDMAAPRGIRMKCDFDPAIGEVQLDSNKCHVVVGNILLNAIKHSSDDSDIIVKTSFAQDGYIRLSVSDQGAGEITDAIFSSDDDSTLDGGLGLAYCKLVVETLGGRISASNAPEGGALYTIDFPGALKKCSTPTVESPVPAAPSAPAGVVNTTYVQKNELEDMGSEVRPVTDLAAASVLIVEDDLDLNEYLQSEFEDSVSKVYSACNGVEALKILRANEVNIIVSDVMMPEMDGFTLCRTVKTDVNLSHIPVILLTARSDENSRKLGYKNGADDYLTKPFDIDVLRQTITKLFLNRELSRQSFASDKPMPKVAETTFSSADEKFFAKFNDFISENLTNPDFDMVMLTKHMEMGRTMLYTKVKNLTGMNMQEYVNKMRMELAINLLLTTNYSLAEVSEKAGFSSPRYFSSSFKSYTGVTPSQYKKDHTS